MKNRIHFIAIISFLTLIIISPEMIAQSTAKKLNYSKHPYWIEMMNDPKANYFETVKAYEQFWQNKKLPLEEDDVIGQTKKEPTKKSFLSKWFKSKEEREEEEIRKYSFDIKKFKHWKLKVMPFVQEDGSILDADERLKLWQNQQH
jgi:ribosomal protein L14E/L6E/L27E